MRRAADGDGSELPLRQVKRNRVGPSASAALWRQGQVDAGVDVEKVCAFHLDPESTRFSCASVLLGMNPGDRAEAAFSEIEKGFVAEVLAHVDSKGDRSRLGRVARLKYEVLGPDAEDDVALPRDLKRATPGLGKLETDGDIRAKECCSVK